MLVIVIIAASPYPNICIDLVSGRAKRGRERLTIWNSTSRARQQSVDGYFGNCPQLMKKPPKTKKTKKKKPKQRVLQKILNDCYCCSGGQGKWAVAMKNAYRASNNASSHRKVDSW